MLQCSKEVIKLNASDFENRVKSICKLMNIKYYGGLQKSVLCITNIGIAVDFTNEHYLIEWERDLTDEMPDGMNGCSVSFESYEEILEWFMSNLKYIEKKVNG